MKIYGISGLGADKRVFQYLTLDCEFIPLDWIAPKNKETIERYSMRLAQNIEMNEDFGILGVSFGGLVATEISKKLNPKLTILISSAETKRELRNIYRLIGKTGIINYLPKKIFFPPRKIANWAFGAKQKQLLNHILDDADLKFTKWAIGELTSWNNTKKLKNRILKIGGTNDKLIPPSKDSNIRLIEKGEHFMIVDRAEEISEIINKEINTLDHNRFCANQ